MQFIDKEEQNLTRKFLNNGFLIHKAEKKKSLTYIHDLILKSVSKILHSKKINLNNIHKIVQVKDLNEFRLTIIKNMNSDRLFRFHYFNLSKKNLYNLVGNELMMQKNINLSIQFPNDNSSLLPIHSDVWSGDSPFEMNLWVPLVNCYKTKSMYILQNKYLETFNNKIANLKYKSSKQIFDTSKKMLKWLKVDYGNCLLFNQGLPHGNVTNKENETRWSMNCRFKTHFSPYHDKKIGEFFTPITTRAMTELGLKYQYPFRVK